MKPGNAELIRVSFLPSPFLFLNMDISQNIYPLRCARGYLIAAFVPSITMVKKSMMVLIVTGIFALKVLGQREYTSLDEALRNPESVTSLNLKGYGLGELPASIGLLVNLQHLDLSANHLTALPATLFTLKKLKYLNLSANRLTFLPVAIAKLKNLEELEIAFNHIRTVPKEIGTLSKLKRFMAAKNNLKSVPVEMAKLTSMDILDFSYNWFTTIPVTLTQLPNLKALDMSFNRLLTSYPPQIKNLQSLKLFNLKSTKIPDSKIKELNTILPDCTVLL
jgi:Leucine-rich repeat (LRR) protein